jgi:CheY-like chemotaxis protein
MTEDLVFLDDDPQTPRPQRPGGVPWRVLIVDDDEGVHSATRFALERVQVDGRPLHIADVYSAEDARKYLSAHDDVAMALVDVVMESDHAGLDLIRWVRTEQNNQAIRLVLRTGQPGQAPERDVVAGYDIDDYKTKSELTSQKLYTLVHASLRSYQHIRVLERNLAALRRIITAASSLHRAESMSAFASGVLEQLVALLDLSPAAALCEARGVVAKPVAAQFEIIAATGEFADHVGKIAEEVLPADVATLLSEALARRESVIRGRACACYFGACNDLTALVYVGLTRDLSAEERELIDLFMSNMSVAYSTVAVSERCGRRPHCP